MPPVITSEIIVAYAQCPRKAYLLLFSPGQGKPHEYIRILEWRQRENHERYLDRLRQKHTDMQPYTVENLGNGSTVLLKASLQADGLAAVCDVLTRVEESSSGGQQRYEPTLCVGTHSIGKEQKLALAFTGYVLGRLQHTPPLAGRLIAMDGTCHTVTLDKSATDLMPLLAPLQAWTTGAVPAPPPIILNKHCPLCPFQRACRAQAEQEDNLSLLDSVTARGMRQYEKKGIFTIKQLSYLFKPRKPRKRHRKPPPVTHKVELQALAIREQKIYLQELPALSRQPVELFVDMEGVPDKGRYYLIGLLVCQGDTTEYYAFWANTDQDEGHMWHQFLDKVTQYREAPLYHYGSYEPRALETLARRYQSDVASLRKRLVNVNSYIYGKVYFPLYSNRLKEIGAFLGARWTSPDASGLQTLVWRQRWEETGHIHYQTLLVTYNEEDCRATKLLMDALTKMQDSVDTVSGVEFADRKRKQPPTEMNQQLHSQFGAILRSAHFGYDEKKIHFSQDQHNEKQRKRGGQTGKRPPRSLTIRPMKIVKVPQGEVCPKCGHTPLTSSRQRSRRLIIDLVLTRHGVKKTVTEYVGNQDYCSKCSRSYSPPGIRKYERQQLYDHGLKAWMIYQRIALRLPYESILELLQEHFHETISPGRFVDFVRGFAHYYTDTEKEIAQHLLKSPFIHIDETRFVIQGVNWYVWVFTNEEYVIFKLSETREATLVHDYLTNYKGVLISDFYAGYDSVKCRQQKCWVHLIRDLNDDLLENPFDMEYALFVLEVRNLIVPIMEAVQQYGLKRWHLQKFKESVDKFYQKTVTGKHYKSELVLTYQKRFIRYRESLFTFLEQDGMPWHNNTAERAIRPVAKQRTISSSFCEGPARDYLLLLSIRQTCRFQGKSFFKFLFSKETDLENFGSRTRRR